jgi:O-antigen/teichoic acid export membrane protein
VLRNALWLVLAQVVGTPLSILVNATMGRYLGPEDFGHFYLAGTFTGFGFLVVEWGQTLAIPALVARDRTKAGELLGTALSWRAAAAVVVAIALVGLATVLGKGSDFRTILLLMVVVVTISQFSSACQATVQGFERTDVSAFSTMGQNLLNALLVIPTLLLGGRLRSVLVAQATAWAVTLTVVVRAIRGVGIGKLSFDRGTLKALLVEGYPFLFMGLAMTLQPLVDAVFMAEFAAPESIGWYAAAQKLVGVLVFPAAALIGALYPTLCRLQVEDPEAFIHSARSALRTATILVVPVTVGCAFYPDIGIQIFSRESYGPAELNLRIVSPFIFLVYFTMVVGICLAAMGKQRKWAVAQCLCVLTSAILDPILIPWFQKNYGNGGLGVCVASDVSELVMLGSGLWLLPRHFFDLGALKKIALALLAGGAMAGTALLLSGINSFLSAPVAVAAYVGSLFLFGGVDKEQIDSLKAIIDRKRKRAAA